MKHRIRNRICMVYGNCMLNIIKLISPHSCVCELKIVEFMLFALASVVYILFLGTLNLAPSILSPLVQL